MQIHNAAVTGSFTYNGIDISDITGSEQSVTSLNDFSSSILNYTSSNNQSIASLFAATASLYNTTSSLLDYNVSNSMNIANLFATSASLNASVAQIQNATASLYAATASIYGATSSLFNYSASTTLRINALDQYTASLNTRSASFACVDSTNTFACTQYFSNTSNAVSFTSTGSLYSDGGVRITKDMYVSGTAFFNNVTVFGTQSVAYISSSQLNIGTNIITVNTDTPSVRFGGLAVYDSGSTGLTGSMLWDSEQNHWVYTNPSGSTYSGGMFISGPRASSLGTEQGTTSCMLLAGQGGDHLTSSAIYHSSTVTCIPNTLIGSTVCSTMANASCIGIGTTSPSTTLDVNGTGRFGSAATKLTTYSDSAYSGIFNGASLGSNESIYMGDARMFFFASGSERMRLTSTGLGIGTTSPDIFGRGDGFDVGISSACVGSTQNMSLQLNAGATAGRGAQLYMGQGGTRHFTISSNVTETSIGTTSNTPLRFVTCDSLERLRFTNTGIACFACQVCAPSSIIKGTINEQLVLDFVIGAGSYTHQSFRLCGANQYRLIGNTNGNFVLRNDVISSDVLTFACAGGATFACSVIAGNVFASYSGTNAGVEFGNSGSGGQFGFLKWDNGSNYLYLGHSYGSAFNRNLVINSSGNVGIGTATIPSDRILQIHSSCAYARMALTNTSTGVAGGDGLIFQMENCFAIIKNQETSCLVLGTNGRETDIVINQNGNVGIGQIPINKFTILAGNSNVLDLFDTGAGFGIGMQAMNSAATVFRSWDFYASKYQFFNGNAIFSGGNSADVNNTPIRVPNNKFLTFYNAADTGWAFTMGANSDNSGGIGGLQGINFNTGASLAQRMTITSTGISCFACQVCVPGLSITSISGLSMNNGISARQTTSRKLMFTNWNVGDSNAIKLLNISLNTNTKIIGDITIYKGARTSNHAFVGKAFIWASNAGSFAASAVCLFNPTSTFNGGDSYLGNIWWCTQTSDLYYCVSTEANYEFIGFEINTVGADSPTITYAF